MRIERPPIITNPNTGKTSNQVYQNTSGRYMMVIADVNFEATLATDIAVITCQVDDTNPPVTPVAFSGIYSHSAGLMQIAQSLVFIVPPLYYWRLFENTFGSGAVGVSMISETLL